MAPSILARAAARWVIDQYQRPRFLLHYRMSVVEVAVNKKPKNKNGTADLTRKDLLARITIDPKVCFGKPCIRGYRIWVSLILDFLASGTTKEEILRDYPELEGADINACIAYGAEMSRERYVEIPIQAKG